MKPTLEQAKNAGEKLAEQWGPNWVSVGVGSEQGEYVLKVGITDEPDPSKLLIHEIDGVKIDYYKTELPRFL